MATNWAGNVTYRANEIHRPASVAELQSVVVEHSRIRALGTGHSFNDLADSPGVLVSLAELPPDLEVDSDAATVRVAAGVPYSELAARLDRHGFALHTLASLPHISVGGACATATHGSGVRNGGLATCVTELEIVTASGEVVTISRDGDQGVFDGAVVGLGALGVVISLTLAVVPTFEVRQHIHEGLALDVVAEHFTELVSGAYSVCLFTDWHSSTMTQVWIQQRTDEPESTIATAPWFTARPADGPRHPVSELSPANCTTQLGVAGRWFERLPHFRPDFTPSSGEELQSEYMVHRDDAVAALRALDTVRDRIHPALMICELRTVAADELWLSPMYRQDSVSIHFTWIADTRAVLPVVRLVEELLAPFRARPHWAKVFTTPPAVLHSLYPRLPDFRDLVRTFDPAGKFGNPFLERCLDLPTGRV